MDDKYSVTKSKKKDEDIIQAARDCLDDYQSLNADNIARAKEAILFRSGDQWPAAIKADRENPSQDGGPRPCPVLDKTNQYVRQIINEERQNRAAIKVRPVDDESDIEVAEIYTGIIRHIEDASNAIVAYTNAGEHAIDGGFGYFRIVTEYADDKSFDQDIRIKRIANRFSVALGPHSEPDGSDAQEGVVWEDIPLDEFKAKYPKAKTDGFEATDSWSVEKMIRIAEYMCVESETMSIHLMPDGSVVTDEELAQIKVNGPNQGIKVPEPIKSRSTQIKTVKWYKLSGVEVLEEADMIGTYIPIIKVIGNEIMQADGKSRLSGVIEAMMDPQRLHNFAHAGFIENVALAPRAPWVAAQEAINGFEDDYADANRRNIAVLPFNHRDGDGNPLPAPQRTPPAGISPGWDRMLQNTEHGVESAVGMYGPTVGAKSQEKSGIALQEQKIQGMIGNFHLPDNLARAIQYCGRILIQWIPKVLDTKRVARIIGEDGESDMAHLDPDQEKGVMPRMDKMNQEIGKIYNLGVGKFDLTVSTGPSYTSKRQEAVNTQTALIQSAPELMPIIGDILFKNMDSPGSDEISERLLAMAPPQVQKLKEGKDKGNPMDPQVQQQMMQIEQAGQQINEKGQQLQQFEQLLQQRAQEAAAKEQEIQAAAVKLESDRKIFMAEYKAAQANSKVSELNLENQRLQAISDVKDAQDQAEPGEQEQHPTQQQPVTVIDSAVAAPLSEVAQAVSQVAQLVANTTQIMAQISQDMQQSTEAVTLLAAQQARPKQARLSDGRIITMKTIQ